MGACVIVSAFLSSFIFIRGESILCRKVISEFNKWVNTQPSVRSISSDIENNEDTATPVVQVVELRQHDSLPQDSFPSEQRPIQNENQNENFISPSVTEPNVIVISPNVATATFLNSKQQHLDTNVCPEYGLSQSISLDKIQSLRMVVIP